MYYVSFIMFYLRINSVINGPGRIVILVFGVMSRRPWPSIQGDTPTYFLLILLLILLLIYKLYGLLVLVWMVTGNSLQIISA